MLCPHCRVAFRERMPLVKLEQGSDGRPGESWSVGHQSCPECKNLILHLLKIGAPGRTIKEQILVWPRGSSRAPCPREVPKDVAEDYREACLILGDSPKSAAALGRRCLQYVLENAAKVKAPNLSQEIDAVMATGHLPPDLAESIDAVRTVGNFAAHPMKSLHTGEIMPVETGEAEWTLDTVKDLFDHYYVKPAVLQARRAAHDKKLEEAGKPPLK